MFILAFIKSEGIYTKLLTVLSLGGLDFIETFMFSISV